MTKIMSKFRHLRAIVYFGLTLCHVAVIPLLLLEIEWVRQRWRRR